MARRTTGHPILPIGIFEDLLNLTDEDTATEILDQVQEGTLDVSDVERFMNRPDIDPSDWQDFENGWRPTDW